MSTVELSAAKKTKKNLLPEMLSAVDRAGDDVSCAIKQHIPSEGERMLQTK